jgi:hypothetical protein
MHGGGTYRTRRVNLDVRRSCVEAASSSGPRRRFARLAFDAVANMLLLRFDMQPSNERGASMAAAALIA